MVAEIYYLIPAAVDETRVDGDWIMVTPRVPAKTFWRVYFRVYIFRLLARV
jgi:hypothetical protein